MFYLMPLLFLSACVPVPKLTLRPQPSPATNDFANRYPEVTHAYHFGRYADPNDDSVMHEQHVVYRVEENSRWDFHPDNSGGNFFLPATPKPHDAAFSPTPVNDAILAEVNSQRLATVQIMAQSQSLTASLAQFQNALRQTKTNLQQTATLRATVTEIQHRLDTLDTVQGHSSSLSMTNESADSSRP